MKRLYRSKKNRYVAGVAGGIAEYFDVDVALVRVLLVLAILIGGGGILAYLVAWIILPEDRGVIEAQPVWEAGAEKNHEKGLEPQFIKKRYRNGGLLLIGLGIAFLAAEILPRAFFNYTWPLVLIGAGAFLLLQGGKEAGQ